VRPSANLRFHKVAPEPKQLPTPDLDACEGWSCQRRRTVWLQWRPVGRSSVLVPIQCCEGSPRGAIRSRTTPSRDLPLVVGAEPSVRLSVCRNVLLPEVTSIVAEFVKLRYRLGPFTPTTTGPCYIPSTRTAEKTPLPAVTLLLLVTQPLPRSGCFSGSAVLAFIKYVIILLKRVWTVL
jgi:hypothetical protein